MEDRGLATGSLVFKAGAISNFLAALPAFVAYDWLVETMVPVAPNYPFLVWIWACMGIVWGIFFWELSLDLLGKRDWIKYAYMEKGTVAACVAFAVAKGDAPLPLLLFSLVTDVLWIVLFAIVHWRIVAPRRA